ncbi:MAG: NAD-dependent epimerase/dehydratase family protein [Mucilaginibacter polytrichastri]|nr:NAD-dependent epimerase/dehydratase family protein [Mucilaginibacter polytrichastri]
MQIILGAGGPVANALARLIEQNNEPLRLASRRPIKTSGNTSWLKTDLLNAAEVSAACAGASVIYLTAGLVYDSRIWQKQWPVIIENVMEAAKANDARLIFFDNIYMYGLVNGPIKETTPYHPISKKGIVRKAVAGKMMGEISSGRLKGSIARAADFYGAESKNSFVELMVLSNFAKGKSAMWMGDPAKLHNYTYVPDAAKGMYLLGQDPSSDGQIWHLPTPAPVSGHELLKIAAETYGVKPRYFRLPKLIFRFMGLFQRFMKELVEMYYQVDNDYHFDSQKFEQKFGVKPTGYREGFKQIAQTMIPKSV